MANSTKVAIVGLMILLVVVVAKYVKTGAPVNEGRTDPVVSTGAVSYTHLTLPTICSV